MWHKNRTGLIADGALWKSFGLESLQVLCQTSLVSLNLSIFYETINTVCTAFKQNSQNDVVTSSSTNYVNEYFLNNSDARPQASPSLQLRSIPWEWNFLSTKTLHLLTFPNEFNILKCFVNRPISIKKLSSHLNLSRCSYDYKQWNFCRNLKATTDKQTVKRVSIDAARLVLRDS